MAEKLDKLTEAEEQAKEIANVRIEGSVLQSRMAVLQSENKRLRDKFNQITKENKISILKFQGQNNEDMK
jgi:predicted nuclease with TOPRIM domain